MTQFRKKPVVITAITFDQLVAHGLTQTPAVANGMPWSFTYAGHAITHENDNCYLIPTLEGTMKMGRDDMLITGVKGEIYPCKRDIFEATYEAEPVDVGADLPPHQQRVIDEKAARDGEISRLAVFIVANPVFATLPADELARPVLTDADAAADLAGTPRPDNPTAEAADFLASVKACDLSGDSPCEACQ